MAWPTHLARLMVTLIVANEEKGILVTGCLTAWLMRVTREGGHYLGVAGSPRGRGVCLGGHSSLSLLHAARAPPKSWRRTETPPTSRVCQHCDDPGSKVSHLAAAAGTAAILLLFLFGVFTGHILSSGPWAVIQEGRTLFLSPECKAAIPLVADEESGPSLTDSLF
ncbi:hypothetical protein D623_10009054 [Myotis brandtii]|uniref:Uncharacterized protein n=1 Tax=Myotis brandtii TaxID=109478 RepID=S7MIN2_MYOBR|nr:hypothetical protein D623_10009054 [Myotis brandtii]